MTRALRLGPALLLWVGCGSEGPAPPLSTPVPATDTGCAPVDAVEHCDGVDEDCDGEVDEDAVDAPSWYLDGDGDGYGSGKPIIACAPPDFGWVWVDGDCDDADPLASPDGVEVCGGGDEDCDGLTDDTDPSVSSSSLSWLYVDTDGDGYGVEPGGWRCPAEGWVAQTGDCAPEDPDAYPTAPEVCDAVDQDCDGRADEGTTCLVGEVAYALWTHDEGGLGGGVLENARVRVLPDVSGDGVADVFVGAYALGSGRGMGFVAEGTRPGENRLEEAYLRVTTHVEGGGVGRDAAAADFDGDGSMELAISAPVAAYVELGPTVAFFDVGVSGPVSYASSSVGLTADWVDPEFGYSAALGWAMASLDVNGDGDADLLAGSLNDEVAYVFHGPITETRDVGDATMRLEPEHWLSYSAEELASPGDLDGDGLDDMVISAYEFSLVLHWGGAVYVVYGQEGPLHANLADVGSRLDGPAENGTLGISVDGLGDVDGDGLPDFGVANQEKVWVVTQAPQENQWVTAASAAELYNSDGWLNEVSNAGDVNQDGHREVMVGAYFYGYGDPFLGMAGVVPGPVSGSIDVYTDSFQLMGQGCDDYKYCGQAAGYEAAGGEDLDGDGVPDLVIAAPASLNLLEEGFEGGIYLVSGVDILF